MIEIIKSGTKAITVINQISGIITAVTVRSNRLTYEFSYFNGGEYKTVWLDEVEFETGEKEKEQIGFSNNK